MFYKFSIGIDLEEYERAKDVASEIEKLVPTGMYYAIVCNTFVAPNSRRDGNNLVVDFSIHQPMGLYNGRIVRKYISLANPGRQLLTLFGANNSPMLPSNLRINPSELVGKIFQISVRHSHFGGQRRNEVRDIIPFQWDIPQSIRDASQFILKLVDPQLRGIYRGELSVDYYSKAAKVWVYNEEDELQPDTYHETTEGWIISHILGHNRIKLLPKTDKIYCVKDNKLEGWVHTPLIHLEVNNTLYTWVINKEAKLDYTVLEEFCAERQILNKLQPKTHPLVIPWYNFSIKDRFMCGEFKEQEFKDSLYKQINFIKNLGVIDIE